ncbi:Tetratricopeptide repeat protein 5 [Papilio xuthus]|uniref:Tetratricopeptide repeat protein 5 n=1 Tax=Papilio xuthus TaxID=66420 RepID=A0A0N1PF28_PAPXU|nr:Tetratricopeptide repeat protein 5 [Papilio xuthus]
MNVKDAKASFEGALKHERNRLSLRCLSIILRQESGNRKRNEATALLLNSVEMAREAVAQDIKDGTSWMVLGNAYLCQFFTVAQDPATLKLCMSAYKQAWLDPIARGQPDLYYNKGIALKYEEIYNEALQNFDHACRLDPLWEPPQLERTKLANYLKDTNELVRTRGKLKTKRLTQLVQVIRIFG